MKTRRRPSRSFPPASLGLIQAPQTVSPSRPRHLVRSVLATWTGVLVVLVVSTYRTIPPMVLASLLPYLALVAWHLLDVPARAEADRDPVTEETEDMSGSDADLEGAVTPSSSLGARPESSENPETTPAPATDQRPLPTSTTRVRKRVRPRAAPEPSTASWVQVGPGRFIRGEVAQPSLDPLGEGELMAQVSGTLPDLAADDPDEVRLSNDVTDLATDGPHEGRLSDDAVPEGLKSDDPAGPTDLPFKLPGAAQPEAGTVRLSDDEDHVLPAEGMLAEGQDV